MSIDKISNFDDFSESSYGEFRQMAHNGGDGKPHPVPGNKKAEFNQGPEVENEEEPEEDDREHLKDSELLDDMHKIEVFTGTIKNVLDTIDMHKVSPYAKARIKDAMKSLKRAHIYMMDLKQGKFD